MHEAPAGLDDPAQAAHALGRFRAILTWMILAAATGIVALARVHGRLRPVATFAVIDGVGQ